MENTSATFPSLTKVVESPHYHLWTDALHARSLARQAHNKWDRGTYVRWCVNTSWTALEVACQDSTEDPNISYSFRKNLDVNNRGQTPIHFRNFKKASLLTMSDA